MEGGPECCHCNYGEKPCTCQCHVEDDNRRAEIEEAQHQEEMRQLEEQAMEEYFRRHPHG